MNERFDRRPRFGHNDRQRFSPPVSVDEELDVKIEAVGEKGDGVAKKDGFVLFIPNVKEGDYVRVKVTKVLRKVGFAEVVGAAQTPEPVKEEIREPEPPQEQEEEFQPSEDDSEDFGEETDEVEEDKEEPVEEEKEEELAEDDEELEKKESE